MTCTTRDPADTSQTPTAASSSERRAASFDNDAMFGLAALLILCVMMAGALALLLL